MLDEGLADWVGAVGSRWWAAKSPRYARFDWLAESLAANELGSLNKSRRSFFMPLPFFFDPEGEGWSAMRDER